MILPTLTFALDTSEMERQMAELVRGGDVVAIITNTAQSADGLYYWEKVNNGRGPVRPINAKALRWVDREGREVFAKYAKPSVPRHIRERALPVIRQEIYRRVEAWNKSSALWNRAELAELVNQLAEQVAVPELQARTPTVTGNLQQSYEVKRAE